jgi:NitT/TauT family transport system substrate-binding protein
MDELTETKSSGFNRRRFLANMSAVGAALFLGLPRKAAAEPPPETMTIRLTHFPAICLAPQYLAQELLLLEGFSKVEYVEETVNSAAALIGPGKADVAVDAAPSVTVGLAEDDRIVALGGLHAGCYELFAAGHVRTIRDLRGKSVSISGFGSTEHIFIAAIVAYVGMDPRQDIRWSPAGNPGDAMQLFVEGKADAFLGFAPQPYELRAKKIGHVIVNTTQDQPWSQYFCCMPIANRQFVQKHPVATKRALRALLKATDLCAQDPERAARFLVAKGYEPRYEVAIEVLKSLPYNRWRDANPEDTMRFHALRLHEVGMIKTSPQKLITQGTDWRFFNELKKELKA